MHVDDDTGKTGGVSGQYSVTCSSLVFLFCKNNNDSSHITHCMR